ncbi:MAG: FAD-dependent monooxygenase [Arenimonas sp.]|nr:FAD-dependent monooxygenase [Arenimonas sp.]
MKTDVDIAVIGAGAVGLAAALMAAQQGLRVAIVEAHAPVAWRADQPDLRVYALALDNQVLLENLGVWPAVKARRAEPYSAMTVFDEVQGSPLRFNAGDLGRSHLGHIVENNVLVEALWQALQPLKNVSLHCPDKIRAVSDQEDSVMLTLQSGLEISAGIAIGADGARSKVRDLIGIETSVHDYAQKGLVAFVKTELPHRHTAWQRFLSTGPLAFLPFGGHVCSIVWTLPVERADALLQADAETFCRALDSAFAGTLGKTELVSERAAFPLKRQLAKTMMQGRTLLLGDAAHAVHPLAGQGVNLGLRDVAALQEVFIAANARQADPLALNALQRWARQRFSDNATAAYAFENINRVFSNSNFALSLLRGPLLGVGDKITPLKNAMARYAAGI